MLTVDNLAFSFDVHKVLKNLSLNLAQGEIGTLIGPSGSGKTTLFRLLTGILPVQGGKLSIDGRFPPEAKHYAAYMMQEDLLLPWRTVIDNMTLPGEIGPSPIPLAHLRQDARLYLHELGLGEWENAYPRHLSGGMRQRVSLARALLQKRPLLLLDEPFASLDINLREQMHGLLYKVREQYGTTILMITHDFRDALSLSDRIFLLSHGRIAQEWTIDPDIRQNSLKIQTLCEEIKTVFTSPQHTSKSIA